jgi:hypothetical protein
VEVDLNEVVKESTLNLKVVDLNSDRGPEDFLKSIIRLTCAKILQAMEEE